MVAVAVAVVRDRVAPEGLGEGDGEGFVGFDGGVAGDLDCDGLGGDSGAKVRVPEVAV